ncbi:MAG: hypothetical protein JW850_04560 [Thermoflexales bacterium]|nr:hypothetical protein [Thermoflexales bacterium]
MQTITLRVPDSTYQRVQRASQVVQSPAEKMLVDTIEAAFPPLDDTPPDMAGEMAAMALLSDEALESIARATMPPDRQQQLDDLLDEQGRAELDESGQRRLAAAMAEYGRTMLRRARAVALLLKRGRPIPPLERLSPRV